MSELVREALREYEHRHRLPVGRWLNEGSQPVPWDQMMRDLREISRSGKKVNLTKFLVRDRLTRDRRP